MQHLNSSETLTWFDCLCTCMFRRPLRAEYPWWVIEDASIWSSSTRWDSKPRGGHSKDRILYCVIRALTALSERLYYRHFHFLQRKTICAEAGASSSSRQSESKRPNSSWKPKPLCGKNMSALTFTALGSEFHWTHRIPILRSQIPTALRGRVFLLRL